MNGLRPATERAALCPELGHPGATYNPHMDQTWCTCGARIYPGNRVSPLTRNHGPLAAWPTPEGEA